MEHVRFLCLETALSACSVCLAEDDTLIAEAGSDIPNSASDHIHRLADTVLQTAGWQLRDLQAIAVSIGPGSYTGLRIGLAAAKGYAYALSIPIVTVSTLQAMAWGLKHRQGIDADRYAPAIDARRDEIFWAMYDRNLQALLPEAPLIVDEAAGKYFEPGLRYALPGSGATKIGQALNLPNLDLYAAHECFARDLIGLAFSDLKKGNLADPAYLEPNYIKGFHHA